MKFDRMSKAGARRQRGSSLTSSSLVEVLDSDNDASHVGTTISDFASGSLSSPPGSKIIEFYRGKSVFLTGASGFLGKVILWKLIENCHGIGRIYVLMRSKKGVPAHKRLTQLLNSSPFTTTRTDRHDKVSSIEGDMTADELGLSGSDRTLIQEQVHVVIHSAASIKFDAPLKDNLRDNVYGTRSVVELCSGITNLKALVHISTAYSNCQLSDIGEKIVPLERDVVELVHSIESLPDDVPESVLKCLLNGRPNTYTYTKAIAEHYVARLEGKRPVCIVRPSIVISAIKEPMEGWQENMNGASGLTCLIGLGLQRSNVWMDGAKADMVPVDYVASSTLCAAYQTAENSPNKLLVFNMTAGQDSVSWGELVALARYEMEMNPTSKVLRPILKVTSSRWHRLLAPARKFYSEFLFAILLDTILMLLGQKRFLMKLTKTMHHSCDLLKPFITKEWRFSNENVIKLYDSLSSVDKSLFFFNMRGFNWSQEINMYWIGIRRFLLKEPANEQLDKEAKFRYKIVKIAHYALNMLIVSLLVLVGCSSIRLVNSVLGSSFQDS